MFKLCKVELKKRKALLKKFGVKGTFGKSFGTFGDKNYIPAESECGCWSDNCEECGPKKKYRKHKGIRL